MKYVGIHTQQVRNNTKSGILLILFPVVILALVFLFLFIVVVATQQTEYAQHYTATELVWPVFLHAVPYTLGIVAVWFIIAYFSHSYIISHATHSKPLERREHKRVYNLVENLCMSQGMPMPKINVIDDSSLNAFASGINKKSYTVTLTTGIITKLNDEELKTVIAHELTHIKNQDVRLLIISIVFVGIFSLVAQMALNMLRFSSGRSRDSKNNGAAYLIIAIVVAVIGYLIASLMRFAISRNREYMADAGSAEMTRNPLALASALRKIAGDPKIEAVKRSDVAQLFIEHPLNKNDKKNAFTSLFATHPPITKRIAILEQF
ncbi:MAG: M48 family metallopeptidase [Bacteroidales bacterium]|jgi:heat shock protein HtpX|nr:M48 family metallopeptidase [Bacteroidales bacterium]